MRLLTQEELLWVAGGDDSGGDDSGGDDSGGDSGGDDSGGGDSGGDDSGGGDGGGGSDGGDSGGGDGGSDGGSGEGGSSDGGESSGGGESTGSSSDGSGHSSDDGDGGDHSGADTNSSTSESTNAGGGTEGEATTDNSASNGYDPSNNSWGMSNEESPEGAGISPGGQLGQGGGDDYDYSCGILGSYSPVGPSNLDWWEAQTSRSELVDYGEKLAEDYAAHTGFGPLSYGYEDGHAYGITQNGVVATMDNQVTQQGLAEAARGYLAEYAAFEATTMGQLTPDFITATERAALEAFIAESGR